MEGDLQTYWKKTGGENLSEDFKDLIIRMFSYDGSKRPSTADIRSHPWMQKEINLKDIKNSILSELAEKRSEMT